MGEAARRRPGPLPSLSQEQVVSAALAVMDRQGLAAVSFRSVAADLGVHPTALYTYVSDKNELLNRMWDHVSSTLTLSADVHVPPAEQIEQYYLTAWRTFLQHSELYRLVRRMDAVTPDLDTGELLCAVLAQQGLDPAGVAALQSVLLQYTIGNALSWSAIAPQGPPYRISGEYLESFESLDAARYPHLTAVGRALAHMDGEAQFVQGLRAIFGAWTGGGSGRAVHQR